MAGSCRWGRVIKSWTRETSSPFRSFKSEASVSPAATLCLCVGEEEEGE